MTTLELAAAAVMGSQLIEAKYHVKEDVLLAQKTVREALPFLYRTYRGRVSYWYPFEDAARKYKNKPAVLFPRPRKDAPPPKLDPQGFPIYDDQFTVETFTYKELYNIVLRLLHLLKYEYGVTSEQTIALDCMNKPLFIFLWLALWNIGACPAFLNFNTQGKPLVHCLKITHVTQVFIDPDCCEPIRATETEIRSELPGVQLHYLNEEELYRRIQDPKTPKYRAPDETRRPNDGDHDCAALIYTLGTTGLPKAGIMSWRKAFMALKVFGYIVKVEPSLTVLTAMPLYHLTAAMLGVCPALLNGACVAVAQKFSALTFWTQAKLLNATHIQYVGEVCRYLLNAPPHPDNDAHSVTKAYGNGLRKDIWLQFKERFHIDMVGEFYALTELPIATTNVQYGTFGVGACRKYGAILNLLLGLTQTLVKMDPEDDNEIWRDPKTGFARQADYDQPGELLMRIMNPDNLEKTFQGYYGNKKATLDKIVRDVFRKGDAWFRSGDLLKMDDDGLLYFVDRLGDTFRWKSENVSASEVENELMGSGTIKQSVVVGVQVPKHEGRAGFAVLEPLDEYLESPQDMLDKMYAHVSTSLPKYAIPMFVKVIPAIEASHNHKVPKNTYKKQKLPKGDDGLEVIYWLNKNRYEELTEDAWAKIMSGESKL